MLQKSYSDDYKPQTKNINHIDPKAQPIIGAFIQLYYFIVGAGAVPVRLLVRKDIGERSISPLTCVVSFGLHIWYVYEYIMILGAGGFYFLFGSFNFDVGWNLKTLILCIVILFNGFNIYLFEVFFTRTKKHFRKIIQHAKDKHITGSSYFRGNSIYYSNFIGDRTKTILGSFKIDEEILRMIVEPRKVFYAGIKIAAVSSLIACLISYFFTSVYLKCLSIFIFSFSSVGLIISLSSICLFLEEFGLSNRIRNAALDMEDAPRDLKLIMAIKDKFIVEEENKTLLLENKKHPVVKIYQE